MVVAARSPAHRHGFGFASMPSHGFNMPRLARIVYWKHPWWPLPLLETLYKYTMEMKDERQGHVHLLGDGHLHPKPVKGFAVVFSLINRSRFETTGATQVWSDDMYFRPRRGCSRWHGLQRSSGFVALFLSVFIFSFVHAYCALASYNDSSIMHSRHHILCGYNHSSMEHEPYLT